MAIKSIAKKKVANEQDLTRIRREIEIMASLSHKHVIQIYEGECDAVVRQVVGYVCTLVMEKFT